MIPQPKALYYNKETDSYLRMFFIIPESRMYFAGIVNLNYEILEWPTEAQTFEHFSKISKSLELKLSDPMRREVVSERTSDIEYRDNIITIMKEIVDKNEPAIYFKSMRYRYVQEWREKNKDKEGNYKLGVSTLYGYIDKYLAGGRQIDLFTPEYGNCGLRGKEKNCGKEKLGRPKSESNTELDFIMNEDAKEIIRKAYKAYVNRFGLRGAYDNMLTEHYLKNKVKPSYSQFCYWGEKLNNSIDIKKDANGKIIYDKDMRPLKATVRQDTFGPGSEFMMDSTKDNTYAVSLRFQHKYLGRCTLYLTCDVFSGMVTGFYVTPDNASYYNAALTLYNTGINKVEVFKELGLDFLTYEDWPCDYMPFRILGDRGPEFISYMSESIPKNLEIELNNTPPYRPELKSIVERSIRSLLSNIEGQLYGAGLIRKGPKRITKDSKKEAILNYKDISKIIVLEILKHNNTKPIDGYKRTPEMIEDNVPTIPIHLWNWGISKGLGSLRRFCKQELWIKLLPTEKDVTFNREGYLFKGDRWINCDPEGELLREKLVASKSKGDTVTVSYNPTDIKETYLVYDKKFYRILLRSNQDINNLFELDAEDKTKKEINSVFKASLQEYQSILSIEQSNIIKEAKVRSKAIRGTVSTQTNDAKETKKKEIEYCHNEENDLRADLSKYSNESINADLPPEGKLLKLNRVQFLKNVQNVN